MPFLMNLVPGVLKQIWNIGSDYFAYKREINQAQHAVKLEAIKSTSDWELAKITEVGGSWKDEFWTIVLAVPAILVMIAPVVELFLFHDEYHKGDFVQAVIQGMMALDKAPEWYTYSLLTAISASFGIKGYNHYKANGRKDAATDALKDFGVTVVKEATGAGSNKVEKEVTVAGTGDAAPDPATVEKNASVWPKMTSGYQPDAPTGPANPPPKSP